MIRKVIPTIILVAILLLFNLNIILKSGKMNLESWLLVLVIGLLILGIIFLIRNQYKKNKKS